MSEQLAIVKLPITNRDSYLIVITKRAQYEKYLTERGVDYSYYNGKQSTLTGPAWPLYDGLMIMPEEDALAFKLTFGV